MFKVLKSGTLKSLLSQQTLSKLIESSASFFALIGFRVSVVEGGPYLSVYNQFGID